MPWLEYWLCAPSMNPLSSEAINKHVVSERISQAAQQHPTLYLSQTLFYSGLTTNKKESESERKEAQWRNQFPWVALTIPTPHPNFAPFQAPKTKPPNDLLFKDEMKMHGHMNKTMHKWVSGQIKCFDESSAIHNLLLNPETPLAAAT